MTDCTAAKQGPGGHAQGRHGMTGEGREAIFQEESA
jgi:hypothetical protein